MESKARLYGVGLFLVAVMSHSPVMAADAGDRLYRAVPPEVEALSNPYRAGDKVAVSEGKKLYRQNCAICHGVRGNGHGPIGNSQEPKPTSFLKLSYTTQHPDQHFFWAVREGSPGTAMPAFKNTLSSDQVWKIVTYLRYLPEKYHAVSQVK